ncbi:MAG: hypothetical protein HZB31_05340 [Nitrospirae bacterium]|nr:hypothetical protein [Nitrospirota bacterium]
MSDRISLSLLCLLLALAAVMPASAQKAPQAPKPEAAPSSQEDQEPQPEPPKSVLKVEIKDDRLSLELENVDFGAAIKAIGDKAGFKIDGRGEVLSRKLNTKFTDMEIERGVLRLFTLVKENNYMLHYDTRGMISKVEIFGIEQGKAPGVATSSKQPLRPAPALRQPAESAPIQRPVTVAPVPRRRIVPALPERRPVISRPVTPSQPTAQPSAAPKTQAADESNGDEEPVAEIPYVTPQPRLAPAPVR